MSIVTCRSCRWSYAVAGEYHPEGVLGCNPGGVEEFQLAGVICGQYEREAGADEPEEVNV